MPNIEWMPVNDNGWNQGRFLSYQEMQTKLQHLELQRFQDVDPIIPPIGGNFQKMHKDELDSLPACQNTLRYVQSIVTDGG